MITLLMTALGWVLTIVAGLLVYLAAPHQRLLARPGPARRNLIGGGLMAALALACLLAAVGPGTAVYTFLTVLMLELSALPFVTLPLPRRGEGR